MLLVPTFINKTLVLLLCLIFIGQSMASMTMFYSMTSMQSMADKSSITSSHHNMSVMSDCDKATTAYSTTATKDCCAQECDCLTSGCSTASAFTTVIHYIPEIAIANKIASATTLVTSQTPTSPYRPPILS